MTAADIIADMKAGFDRSALRRNLHIHLATEVDKALGGLTREHDHTVLIDGAGRAVRLDNVARWIGGWKPEETP